MKDIFETISANEAMSSLSDVVKKCDLIEKLKGDGPFTLFAPDNDAFNKLNLADILSDRSKLFETLTYHIVEGKLSGEEVRELDCSSTLNGKSLAIKVKHGELVIDNAKVLKTDIECSNGVIHVIDSVFMPHLSGWYGDCGCC